MGFKQYERITCEDGFSVSVQADKAKYCSPRNDTGPYCSVELGFPNQADELILPWAENKAEPTETVYGYTPSIIVWQLFTKHGGIKSGTLPPMVVAKEDWGDNVS